MAVVSHDHSRRRRRRRLARGGAVSLIVVLALMSVGCGGSARARLDARNDLVDQLVEGGLEPNVAECAVDGFFASRSNDDLEAFFDRPALTADESAEFERLGAECFGIESD